MSSPAEAQGENSPIHMCLPCPSNPCPLPAHPPPPQIEVLDVQPGISSSSGSDPTVVVTAAATSAGGSGDAGSSMVLGVQLFFLQMFPTTKFVPGVLEYYNVYIDSVRLLKGPPGAALSRRLMRHLETLLENGGLPVMRAVPTAGKLAGSAASGRVLSRRLLSGEPHAEPTAATATSLLSTMQSTRLNRRLLA